MRLDDHKVQQVVCYNMICPFLDCIRLLGILIVSYLELMDKLFNDYTLQLASITDRINFSFEKLLSIKFLKQFYIYSELDMRGNI